MMLLEKCFFILEETDDEKYVDIGVVELQGSESQKHFQVKAMATKWKKLKSIFLIFNECTSLVTSALECKKEELT